MCRAIPARGQHASPSLVIESNSNPTVCHTVVSEPSQAGMKETEVPAEVGSVRVSRTIEAGLVASSRSLDRAEKTVSGMARVRISVANHCY